MNRLRLNPKIGEERAHAHNQLMHTAAELGVPALIAYIAIIIAVGWMCREICRNTKSAFIKVSAEGLGIGQLAFFIFGLADALPLGSKPGIFFWYSLAIITSLHIISKKQL
jgi:O-antigen ligase